MEKYAIIVAAGSGTRMGTELPKQFLPLHGQPIARHTAHLFLGADPAMQVIMVLPKSFMESGKSLMDGLDNSRLSFVQGGETRFHSVLNALEKVPDGALVLVHDAVRCLLSRQLIQHCIAEANAFGNAVPAITATDTVRIQEGNITVPVERNAVFLVQTPQVFQATALKKAYQLGYSEKFTDDASVFEKGGGNIHLVEGEKENIKITTPLDLLIAEKIMDSRKP